MVKSYREINQDALGREKSKKWYRKYRKAVLFALIAVILAMLAYSVAQNALSTAQTNNVFEIVVNNTDLGQTNGTQERYVRTLYYANSSPIAISLLGHVVGTGASLEMNLNLTVNSTVIQDIDTMTNPGANIHDHASIYFIIPKGSNYSVDNSTGVSYLEWREYPILAGKNGTLSINQTALADLSSVNASLNYLNTSKWNKTDNLNSTIQINRNQVNGQEAIDTAQNSSLNYLNDSKVNKSGDNMTGLLNISGGLNVININVTIGSYYTKGTLYGSVLSKAATGNLRFITNYNLSNEPDDYNYPTWLMRFQPDADSWVIQRSPNTGRVQSFSSLLSVDGTGNLTMHTAGSGIIMKSKDGTKCGFLYWGNDNALNSNSITCP